jgi:hypothetical protein
MELGIINLQTVSFVEKSRYKTGEAYGDFFQPHFLNYATEIFCSVDKAKSLE